MGRGTRRFLVPGTGTGAAMVLLAVHRTFPSPNGLLPCATQGLNYASLHTIESAIAVVVLDDDEPSNMTEMGHMLIHGKDGTDRWFDKSLTMVAFSNGRFGMNVEHSWADAPVVAHMVLCSDTAVGGSSCLGPLTCCTCFTHRQLEHVLLTGDCVPGAYQDDGRTHVEAPSGKGPPRKPTRCWAHAHTLLPSPPHLCPSHSRPQRAVGDQAAI